MTRRERSCCAGTSTGSAARGAVHDRGEASGPERSACEAAEFVSRDPVSGQELHRFPSWSRETLDAALVQANRSQADWGALTPTERGSRLATLGRVLSERRPALARLATLEMGKLATEALAEIDKAVRTCAHYAARAPEVLVDRTVDLEGRRAIVSPAPLGIIFAIAPWNFPFWQPLRSALPALAAGNAVLLKPAPNVARCALALQECFDAAGFPRGVFTVALLSLSDVTHAICSEHVHGVAFTGSQWAGRLVAAQAGAALKKSVVELGGSDAFVVLEDADLDACVPVAVRARFRNCGQSCIAAKRFVVVPQVAEEFVRRLVAEAAKLVTGDPRDPASSLAPMARWDLRTTLHAQVEDAQRHGARVLLGGEMPRGPGAFYPATVLDGVTATMRAWHEELFGPVASIIRVRDEQEALTVANASPYGLGGSVWTRDAERGAAFARNMQCGLASVNSLVSTDPRLPFGGVKGSGFGRELGDTGLLEFVNLKTLHL